MNQDFWDRQVSRLYRRHFLPESDTMRWTYEYNRVEFGDVEDDKYSGEYVDCYSNEDSALLARMVAVALNDAEAMLKVRLWLERRRDEYEKIKPDYIMRFEDGYLQCIKDVLDMIKEMTSESAS